MASLYTTLTFSAVIIIGCTRTMPTELVMETLYTSPENGAGSQMNLTVMRMSGSPLATPLSMTLIFTKVSELSTFL